MVESKANEILVQATFRAKLGTERTAMEKVKQSLLTLGIHGDQIEDITTMTAEACLNAIEHGYGFDASQEYRVELLRQGPEIVLRVSNRGGTCPDWTPIAHQMEEVMADRKDPRGWGLAVIHALSDSFKFKEEGGSTELEIRLGVHYQGGSTVV